MSWMPGRGKAKRNRVRADGDRAQLHCRYGRLSPEPRIEAGQGSWIKRLEMAAWASMGRGDVGVGWGQS